jgi:putative tricarboxylic transport membrane protein
MQETTCRDCVSRKLRPGRRVSSGHGCFLSVRPGSALAVLVAAFLGVVGYIFMRLECEPAPMILGFVLGPLMEDNLRRAMRISGGDPMIFIHRPISLGLLIAAAVLLVMVALPAIRRGREEAFQES